MSDPRKAWTDAEIELFKQCRADKAAYPTVLSLAHLFPGRSRSALNGLNFRLRMGIQKPDSHLGGQPGNTNRMAKTHGGLSQGWDERALTERWVDYSARKKAERAERARMATAQGQEQSA